MLAAAVLTVGLSLGVLAATEVIDMSAVYRAVLGEGSEGSGFNINTTAEQNGSEFTLQSAVVDGNNGFLFFAVRDLTGDRLSKQIGWGFTNIKTHGLLKGYVSNNGIEILDYDEVNKTLFAMMKFDSERGLSLDDKLTLKFASFETDISSNQKMDTGIDLQALLMERGEPQTTTEYADEFSNWTSPAGEEMTKEQLGAMPFLKKNELDIVLPEIDSAIISNIGFVDSKLHIQLQETPNTRTYNRGFFHLLSPDGSELHYKNSVTMGNSGNGGNCYQEYIYDFASPDELAGIRLGVDMTTSGGVVEGPWEFDFVIGSQAEDRIFKLDTIPIISASEVKIEASSISTVLTFDVEINAKYKDPKKREQAMMSLEESKEVYPLYKITEEDAVNYLKLSDGSKVELMLNRGGVDYESYKGDMTFLHSFYDVDMLVAIILDGEEYRLS
jgi:hypothetical protein